MNSRERVRRAVEFEGPDCVPVDWSWKPEQSDVLSVSFRQEYQRVSEFGEFVEDEWGCVWMRPLHLETMGEVRGHPLQSWSQLGGYRFPDPYAEKRFMGLKALVDEYHSPGRYGNRYILGHLGHGLFERLHFLHGFTNVARDLYVDKTTLGALEDKILGFFLGLVEEYVKLGVDAVAFADDWGAQNGLMVRPQLWREFFKPRYAKLFQAARGHGLHVWMHSCGYIYDIIRDLIEVGVNVLLLDQPELLGVERLGKEFSGKVCFRCPVDIQRTMAEGNLDRISAAATKLVWHLGNFQGGFIAGTYGGPASNVLKFVPEGFDRAWRAFRRYGKYPLRPATGCQRTRRRPRR